jgi:hypothetical protein
MTPVSCAYAKTWKGSSAPARSSAEVLEASQIRTRTIQSPYGGRCSPDIGLVLRSESCAIYITATTRAKHTPARRRE